MSSSVVPTKGKPPPVGGEPRLCDGCGHERFFHLGGSGCCLHTQAHGATQRRCLCDRYSAVVPREVPPLEEALTRVKRLREWTAKRALPPETLARELGDIEAALVKAMRRRR